MTLPAVEDPDGLRHLVDAILAVGSDLSLPVTLRRIVESAVTLVGARYGALGVLDESGDGLAEFVHVGLQPGEAAKIDHLPEGRGILGALIVDPRPLRLTDLHAHPDSYGFPPGHPPMTSFLGVPIKVRSQVFGNLYLTEKQGAPEFSEQDEALAVALAGAAAIAIENARLHARVRDIALIQDRERIAADLHDTVIQRLYATGLGLEASLPLASPSAWPEPWPTWTRPFARSAPRSSRSKPPAPPIRACERRYSPWPVKPLAASDSNPACTSTGRSTTPFPTTSPPT
jgi:GAF domain/Histidine kinase